ncbi:MAG: glycosyltransferase family 4 protein [Flavobacteriales bacterium]
MVTLLANLIELPLHDKRPSRVTILYSELADYTLACLKALVAHEVDLLLIHWPINPEAPFQLDLSFCEHYSRDTLTDTQLEEIVLKNNPGIILCSGWMDKGYVNVCKHFYKKIPTVLSMDNHWIGSWRQIFASMMAPFTIQRAFNAAFVPGAVQKQYALKLGFSENHVRTGFYSADVDRFWKYHTETEKAKKLPKRFLYLGRYVKHKGIFDLWEAFRRFHQKHSDWELWCVGTGDQFDSRVESEGIRHFGFVQPDRMLPILRETGVYILPSHFEPWGVSVHEMAAAGFPMLLSDKIGAREAFLFDKENGAVFQSGSVESILSKMKWIAGKTDEELLQMSNRSHALGLMNTPGIWAEKLLSFTK